MLYLLRPIGGFLYVDKECIEINNKKPHPLVTGGVGSSLPKYHATCVTGKVSISSDQYTVN